jgi:broad specificity phosphatase PhoE
MPNEDEAWKLTERETIPDVVARVNHFLQWLICRPETNIVVVSHGVWIECCFYAHCPQALQPTTPSMSQQQGSDRVRNGDLFAGECVSMHGQFQRLENVRRIE